mmetsp:Transcript_3472/g.10629  ORF Transcript_3472/g.10629 Transcript_3472/m.10629 type:complete len:598 (+) Transcript_3472:2-1795(+)
MPLEVPGAAPGVPKGVDLNLDKFDLNRAAEADPEVPEGSWGGEEFVGRAFWKNLSGPTFKDEDRAMLKQLFSPHLSDRREDCELFIPPDTSLGHVQKLRALLKEEATIREQRKEHFLSADFEPSSASLLFPGWKPTVAIAGARAGQLHARPELIAEAANMVKHRAPNFDKCTEDGTRYCIYQLGSLEIRSVREPGSEETVGAVFSSSLRARAPASAEGAWSPVAKTDKVVKAVLYVEHADEEEGSAQRFFALLETDQGDGITAELLEDGSPAWSEDPADLEARKARAKALRAAECSGLTVQDVRARSAEAGAARAGSARGYAEEVLLAVLPAREKAWSALSSSEAEAVRQLGAAGAEAWDLREAPVFGLAWAELSEQQRTTARALGFDEASWCPSASKTATREAAPPASTWSKSWADLSMPERAAAVALGLAQGSWEAKEAWEVRRRQAGGVWERSWAQLSDEERAAATTLELGSADAWDGAAWVPGAAWERRWAQLTEDERRSAEKLGISGAAAWDAAFGGQDKKGQGLTGVWEKSWAQLEEDERLAAKTLGISGPGAWDRSKAKSSAQRQVAQLTVAEQEAMMEEWVKRTYGVCA